MNILLTGASGGLGRGLLRCMVGREGLEVRALVHRASVVMEGCQIVRGDVRDRASLLEAVKGADTVVHLAALTHTNRQEDYFAVNYEGTKNLVEASVAGGVGRFLYVSSLAAQPGGGSYSESKLMAEDIVKNSGLKWIVFRPAEVYGIGSGDAVNKLVGWIRNFKVVPVIGDGSYTLSPAFIDDVVLAMAVAAENEDLKNAEFTLAGPEPMTYIQLVGRISRFLGVSRYKIHVPVLAMKLMAEILFLLGKDFLVRDQIPRLLCGKNHDIELAARLLNYRPRKLEEGLRLCVSP